MYVPEVSLQLSSRALPCVRARLRDFLDVNRASVAKIDGYASAKCALVGLHARKMHRRVDG